MIKKQSQGHYCFLVFEAAAAALKEIERSIMYNESILRYNFIRLEKFVDTSSAPVSAESTAETKDVVEPETVETEQAAATQE